jgi:hypothetical protein
LLIQASLIYGLTDSSERIEPPLATVTFIEKTPNRQFAQLIPTLIAAAS